MLRIAIAAPCVAVLLSGNVCTAQPVRREAVRPDAAYRALVRLESYVSRRTAALRTGWIFGPNLDDCYFFRTRFSDTSELIPEDGDSPQKRYAESHGVPNLDSIPAGERMALYIANYEGRRGAMRDTAQFLCIKHFPGGTRQLENTEHISNPVVYREPLDEWQPRLLPFRTILDAPRPVPALMTSHACYPGLDSAMRITHPDIATWIGPDMACPATFSPFIMQGLLRRTLGYEGPVVTDWVDMGAVNRFLLDYRRRMPARYRELSNEALIVVLALEAGCHFVTGIQNRLLRISRPADVEPVIGELDAYRQTDARWESTVNARLREALSWFARPPFRSAPLPVEPAMGMPFRDKMRLVIGERIEDPAAQWANKLTTKGFQDLWNRQGLLHSQLRAFYVSERHAVEVPEIPYRSDDERVVTLDKNIAWIDALMGDERYKAGYGAVAWETEESSRAWDEALKTFMRERGYTGQ